MKAVKKDFFMEIWKSKSRFLSIFAIVALGVAFYAGIRSAEPDMRLSADTMYDNQKMYDIRVLSTLGLTDDDVEAIKKLPGIKDAVGARSVDVLCQVGDSQRVFHVMEETAGVNEVDLLEGRTLKAENECLVDQRYYMSNNMNLGDVITFTSGDGSDIEDTFTIQSFIVVGIFTDASYLSADRGTSTIGNGNISGLAIIKGDAFASDIYTTVYATVDGADELICYSDEYDEWMDEMADSIEEKVMDAAVERRFAEVKEEYAKNIAEGEVQLEDALEKLTEGEKEYADGYQEYSDGKAALEEAKQVLADARSQLDEGKQELEDGKKELNQAQTEIDKNDIMISISEQMIEQNELELANAELEYNLNKEKYDEAYEQYKDAEVQLADAKAQLEAGRQTYETTKRMVDSLQTLLAKAKQSLTELEDYLNRDIGETENGVSDEINRQIASVKDTVAEYETELAEREKELAEAKIRLDAGEKEYEKNKALFDESTAQLEDARVQLSDAREQLTEAKRQLNDAKAQLSEGKGQLLEGKQEVLSGNQAIAENEALLAQKELEYQDGVKEVGENEKKLADAEKEILDARKELDDGWAEYEDGKRSLEDAREDLKNLKKPEWYILDRNYNQSYVEYGSDAERIGKIGQVFPIIFFIVAALVSLTTMTRMVEEQRTQIGTMKSLGYGNRTIAGKYLLYALIASVGGSLVGGVVGCRIIPPVIQSAYGLLYLGLNVQLSPINWYYYLSASVIAAGCILAATFAACYKELLSTPANLMRPAAPKRGKRTLLERIPVIWKHLTFSQKSTVRNLLRYKKRLFMTMFGICGCMALMITGFGIKDSVNSIVQIQFGELQKYQVTIAVDDGNQAELEKVYAALNQEEKIKGYESQYQMSMDIAKGDKTVNGYLVVTDSAESFGSYIELREREGHDPVELREDGIILTEKACTLLHVGVGDTVELKVSDTESYSVPITGITENYIYHYVYMSQSFYKEVFGEESGYNEILVNTADMTEAEKDAFSETYLTYDAVGGVTFSNNFKDHFSEMLGSLDTVIVILVVSAGLLAFVVLYNLNNINITERRRELASLKVLGFYDMEVSMYVFRENVVITAVSLILGSFFGKLLHHFVMQTVEMDLIMFGRSIMPVSYGYSILLTILFSVLINFTMHFKLKKVDMATSLKSVE